MKLDIDFNFWANLDTEKYPGLKKLPHSPNLTDFSNMSAASEKFRSRGIPDEIAPTLLSEMSKIYSVVIPAYLSVFQEYTFDRTSVVWRLNTIMAENMHFDTPADPMLVHFARMFVNLDSQPRIWQTSWPISHAVEMMRGKVDQNLLQSLSANDLWAHINKSVFGKNSKQFWDEQPRHVIFFDPGDVWVVDSRQISHQIFYGRRALSIDFFTDPTKMKNPSKFYLEIAEQFRRDNLGN